MKRMSNTYITGASMVALTFSLNVGIANAATCEMMPTCSEMGFTDTSCGQPGQVATVKCPFDSTKMKCIPTCNLNDHTLTSCPQLAICSQCAYKYKVIDCKPGYYKKTDSNGGIVCSEHLVCPSDYKRTNVSCPYSAWCDTTDICHEDPGISKNKVYCYGSQNGWMRYDEGSKDCVPTVAPGQQLIVNGEPKGIIIDVYTEADNGTFATVMASAYTKQQAYGKYTSAVASCFGTQYTDATAALGAKNQHYCDCGQSGCPEPWNDVFYGSAFSIGGLDDWHLPNLYELVKLDRMGALVTGREYWTSLSAGTASPAPGVSIPSVWVYRANGRGTGEKTLNGLDSNVKLWTIAIGRRRLTEQGSIPNH